MRRFIPLAFLMAASLTLAKSNKDPEGPAPPPLSNVIKDNTTSESTAVGRPNAAHAQQEHTEDRTPVADSAAPANPEIKVIRKADVIIEEYRFNGKMYMVKVTPTMGKPYYLYDDNGSGTMIRHEDLHTHIAPPRWTLFSW